MQCPKCKTDNPEGSMYCRHCGLALPKDEMEDLERRLSWGALDQATYEAEKARILNRVLEAEKYKAWGVEPPEPEPTSAPVPEPKEKDHRFSRAINNGCYMIVCAVIGTFSVCVGFGTLIGDGEGSMKLAGIGLIVYGIYLLSGLILGGPRRIIF